VLEQHELPAGGEVAILVEDAVVGEEPLAVERLDLAGCAHGARVVEVAVEPRDADERDDAAGCAGDFFGSSLGGGDEARPQKQVFGRIARHRELRKEDEVGFVFLGLVQSPEDPLRVPVEVADDGVDLRERKPHGF
jgi:hypothetical protein